MSYSNSRRSGGRSRSGGGRQQDYDNNGRGSLWPNDRAKTDRDPAWTGVLTLDDADYWVSMWENDGGGNNAPEFKLSVKAKDEPSERRGRGRQSQGQRDNRSEPRSEPRSERRSQGRDDDQDRRRRDSDDSQARHEDRRRSNDEDLDDEIPF
jgi:hypothetical protein